MQAEKRGIDASTLKIVAIVGMTLDHIAVVFALPLWAEIPLYFAGGLTYPIMAYLLIEGYRKTSNLKRYMGRLLIFAAIAALPFVWATGWAAFNILFTLLLGLVVLYLYDHVRHRPLFWLAFAGITALTLPFDWGGIGVPLVLAMYAIKDDKRRVWLPLVCLTVGMEAAYLLSALSGGPVGLEQLPWPDMAFMLCSSAVAIPLLLRYNGERGRGMKYFFYAYYPAHLLLLGLLRGLITGVWWPWV